MSFLVWIRHTPVLKPLNKVSFTPQFKYYHCYLVSNNNKNHLSFMQIDISLILIFLLNLPPIQSSIFNTCWAQGHQGSLEPIQVSQGEGRVTLCTSCQFIASVASRRATVHTDAGRTCPVHSEASGLFTGWLGEQYRGVGVKCPVGRKVLHLPGQDTLTPPHYKPILPSHGCTFPPPSLTVYH